MNDWNIQLRAQACEACGKIFTDQEMYHTMLFDEKQDFLRLDVCASCWEKQFNLGARDRKGFVSHWQGVFETPLAPTDPIEKETAETLLRKLIEQNEPRYVPAGYILAVMLERKRILKIKEQLIRDGQRVFVYEQPKTGDIFTITDPNLRLDQLEEVQRDVAALLEHGLNPPVTQPAMPPESSGELAAAPATNGA